jgi:hypothetical protein
MKTRSIFRAAAVLCAGGAAAFGWWMLASPESSPSDRRGRAAGSPNMVYPKPKPSAPNERRIAAIRNGDARHEERRDAGEPETTPVLQGHGRSVQVGGHLSGIRGNGAAPAPATAMTAVDGYGLSVAASPGLRRSRSAPKRAPVLPLAFQEKEPGTIFTDPSHAAEVVSVQDQFIEDIGGEAADPSSPEYLHRWIPAQRLSDLRLRARIGAQAFAAYQREADARRKSASP